MRVMYLIVFVLGTLSMYAQTPPTHTYFETPLIIEDGDNIIDSTDYSIAEGATAGNWYQVLGNDTKYSYLTRDIIGTSGPFQTKAVAVNEGMVTNLDSWDNRRVIKMSPGLDLRFRIAHFVNYQTLKIRITRKDYTPNNAYDDIENAQSFTINECIEVSTALSTPSEVQFQNGFENDVDVFYKFIATTDTIFDAQSYPSLPPYAIYTDPNKPGFQKIAARRSSLGDRYIVQRDSTYYVRITSRDPFDTAKKVICLEEYNSNIHKEQDNYECGDARELELVNIGYRMFLNTFISREEIIESCEEPLISIGQWYQLNERDTTYNYTLYIDTSRTKIHAFTGECGALQCFDKFNYEDVYDFSIITFSVKSGERLLFYLEAIDPLLLEPSVSFIGFPSGEADICEEAIPVVGDTTLSIDFEDAGFSFNSCTEDNDVDKWLTLLGDGRRVIFYANTITEIQIYEGSCESLECKMTSRGISEYLQTENGVEYKIRVSDPVLLFLSLIHI